MVLLEILVGESQRTWVVRQRDAILRIESEIFLREDGKSDNCIS